MDSQSLTLSNQIHIYNNLMDSLIYEKESRTPEELLKKQESTSKLAKEILVVEGDDVFKSRVYQDMDKISSLKPGRKLIKVLSKFRCIV
ncbi:MAG: hypothetical protein H0T62_06420 [Parachlamydiaceae bacterium]|nr:hypothetical protein [Parachlamydiaceae bacterium]